MDTDISRLFDNFGSIEGIALLFFLIVAFLFGMLVQFFLGAAKLRRLKRELRAIKKELKKNGTLD